MSRKKKRSRKTAIPLEALDPSVREHLRLLGHGTVEEYLDWCRAHRLPAHVRKCARRLGEERAYAARQSQEMAVRAARSVRRPDRILRRMLDDVVPEDEVPPSLRPVHAALHDRRTPRAQRAFLRALLGRVLSQCADLLLERADSGCGAPVVYLEALLRIAAYHDRLVRPVDEWRPGSRNAGKRFGSLVRHLFARWAVPEFLDSSWLSAEVEAGRHREWFLHIGQGRNIRTAELPIELTKKMAHHFLQAPPGYSVYAALRWGQVHGLGGNADLVEALRETRLCQEFGDEEFWASVLHFFIRHPMLDRAHVGPIVDYLHAQRCRSERVVDERGRVTVQPPPQPNLSMRGRDPQSLLRQVERWHGVLGKGRQQSIRWPARLWPTFRWQEGSERGGNLRIWMVRELTSSVQLRAEGSAMRHCVATYVSTCRFGEASIWSMSVESKTGSDRVATVEVRHGTRQIVQVRGRCNARPSPKAREVLRRWAGAVELSVADWI